MVPSRFNHHNARNTLKLLVTSLNYIGRFLSSIGSPLYFVFYRPYTIVTQLLNNKPNLFKYWNDSHLISQIKLVKNSLHNNVIFRILHVVHILYIYSDLIYSRYFKRSRLLIRQALIQTSDVLFVLKTDLDRYYFQVRKQLSQNHEEIDKYKLIEVFPSQKIGNYLKNQLRGRQTYIKQHHKRFTVQLRKLNKLIIKGYEYTHLKVRTYTAKLQKLLTVFNIYIKNIFILTTELAQKFKLPKIKWAVYFSASLFLVITATLVTMWITIIDELPSTKVLAARDVKASTKIYDRNGVLLYKIYKDENRTPVSLSEIPDHVKQATLAIEDSEFYTHPGFSIRGMTRAAIRNYQRGELTGGSTITQQLVKNTLLSPEKTIIRKVKEIFLAVEVEMNYTKDEILEMYLNEVSYGGTAYGIQEAAKMYFDKDVQDLTLAEAALLAGLPKSPTDYSPFGTDPLSSIKRRVEVLRLMEENGYITNEQRKEAQKQKLTFATDEIHIKAPHFVMYVRDQLEQKYGKAMVEQGGLEVYTTLDYQTQTMAEQIVQEEVEDLSYLNVGNGAAVVLSPSSGEILAMVGSKDYFDYENDGNVNVTTSLRQPGSSIKLINYAYALSHDLTPATIIDDSPATFLIQGSPPYKPKNYDGRYRGRITLRSAFAESRNIPAVKVLNSYGVSKMIELGKQMGITTWEETNRFGLSLTLGGGEVKLLELANAYATVANYGRKPKLTSILKVSDYKGNVLESNECESSERSTLIALADKLSSEVHASESAVKLPFKETSCEGEKVLDPRVAYLLTDILKDNNARTPAFGGSSLLNVHNHPEIAVKTGTSNDLRDNLTVGYNQNYLVAVWVGNNDNSPMSRVASGITGASPIFNKIMTYLVKDQPSNDWIVPNGLVKTEICTYTGTLPCSGCPTRSEWFLEEKKPDRHCSKDWFENEDDHDENSNEVKIIDNRRNSRIPQWIRDRFDN